MSELLIVQYQNVMWTVGEQEHGFYRCTVISTNHHPAPGWRVGDHCYLTAEELHPTNQNGDRYP